MKKISVSNNLKIIQYNSIIPIHLLFLCYLKNFSMTIFKVKIVHNFCQNSQRDEYKTNCLFYFVK